MRGRLVFFNNNVAGADWDVKHFQHSCKETETQHRTAGSSLRKGGGGGGGGGAVSFLAVVTPNSWEERPCVTFVHLKGFFCDESAITVLLGRLVERQLHGATVGVVAFANAAFVLLFIRTDLLVAAHVLYCTRSKLL